MIQNVKKDPCIELTLVTSKSDLEIEIRNTNNHRGANWSEGRIIFPNNKIVSYTIVNSQASYSIVAGWTTKRELITVHLKCKHALGEHFCNFFSLSNIKH